MHVNVLRQLPCLCSSASGYCNLHITLGRHRLRVSQVMQLHAHLLPCLYCCFKVVGSAQIFVGLHLIHVYVMPI